RQHPRRSQRHSSRQSSTVASSSGVTPLTVQTRFSGCSTTGIIGYGPAVDEKYGYRGYPIPDPFGWYENKLGVSPEYQQCDGGNSIPGCALYAVGIVVALRNLGDDDGSGGGKKKKGRGDRDEDEEEFESVFRAPYKQDKEEAEGGFVVGAHGVNGRHAGSAYLGSSKEIAAQYAGESGFAEGIWECKMKRGWERDLKQYRQPYENKNGEVGYEWVIPQNKIPLFNSKIKSAEWWNARGGYYWQD
ncbi:hypothetical protein ACWD01_36095, partial [Streptomyces sp. NPDC002835]